MEVCSLRSEKYGRTTPKPRGQHGEGDGINSSEDPIPLEDRIDQINLKISLKERYSKAIKEEFENAYQGPGRIINQIGQSTESIRDQLSEALNAEKIVVQSALKTHRDLQLAMRDHFGKEALAWLEDKKCDLMRELNILINQLGEKKRRMEEVEFELDNLERCPYPGSIDWEVQVLDYQEELMTKIVDIQEQLDTGAVLNTRYSKIHEILKGEEAKYDTTLATMDEQLNFHKEELEGVKTMEGLAKYLKSKAAKDWRDAEERAQEDRGERRKEIMSIKKVTSKVLEHASKVEGLPMALMKTYSQQDGKNELRKLEEKMRSYQEEIEGFKKKGASLVIAMQVPDLTHVPQSMLTTRALNKRLHDELEWKIKYTNLLQSHLHSLENVEDYLKYTRGYEEARLEKKRTDKECQIAEMEKEIQRIGQDLEEYCHRKSTYELAILALQSNIPGLTEGSTSLVQFNRVLPKIREKVRELIKRIKELEVKFSEDQRPLRNYSDWTFPQPSSNPKHVRVDIRKGHGERDRSRHNTIDVNEEETLGESSTVPTNQSIKEGNKRFTKHEKIKRGLIKYDE